MANADEELDFEDPKELALFREHGLASLRALCECTAGEVVTTARTRTMRRVDLGSGTQYYIKTQDLTRASLPLRKVPSYFFRSSPIAREHGAMRMLDALGFRVVEVAAFGSQKSSWGMPIRAALVTRALRGFVDLQAWCESSAARDDARATRCFDAAERLLESAHAKGTVLLGAKYRNLLVPREGIGEDAKDAIALVDQPAAHRSKSRRLRAKDWRLLRADRARYGRGR